MVAKRVREFDFREFKVVIVQDGTGTFTGAGFGLLDSKEVVRHIGESLEEAEVGIKQELLARSESYVGLDEAQKLFLRAFPGGFEDPAYLDMERNYKLAASGFVCEALSKDRLDSDIAAGRFDAIATSIKQAYSKTNLLSQFESAALNDCCKKEESRKALTLAVRSLLYGEDLGQGIVDMVAALKPRNAAKWPVVSYLPYLRFPDRHMFLKPEVTKECADRIGYDLAYEATPNIETYASLLGMVDEMRTGIDRLHPKDNIDLQSLIWVLGAPGYVTEMAARQATVEGGA